LFDKDISLEDVFKRFNKNREDKLSEKDFYSIVKTLYMKKLITYKRYKK
jgi:hypothetical protein